ncbi:MAG: sigma-54-dependent transcriptional regulator [Gammaproteobacteria bacterium]
MSQESILVVDDEPDIRNLVQEILMDEGYKVSVAENTTVARKHASSSQPDLVLLDIWMPGEDGISLLKDWQDSGSIACPVVMMSGHGTVETAIEATRLGAYDFIEKPLTMAKLLVSVKRALEAGVKNVESSLTNDSIEMPIGASLPIQSLRDQAKKLAAHDNVLLIKGESGVGKKAFANFVHSLSSRSTKRFITLNEDNFNSRESAKQLLGTEENEVVTPGILELCKGGTVFISDVVKLNSQGQKILAHLLQKKQYRRVGGGSAHKLDVRVMAATQADLQADVKADRFDDELYFLLNVVPVRIPALREHLQDVPELLRYYIDYYCSKENYPYRNFAIAAQNKLLHYTWPGNIRELKNLVQRLLILSSSDEVSAEEVEDAIQEQGAEQAIGATINSSEHEELYQLPLREARESFERSYFVYQLKQVDGNISKLSERVGLERTHLYRKLRALGINTKEAS